jgi:S-DNA-T family DNA segregation ATPase FtsK/SpoIIIE
MTDPQIKRPGEPARGPDWLDWLERMQTSFGRFSLGIGGLILLAFAAMILVALLGLTEGSLLNALSNLLWKNFGWGSFLIVGGAVIGGLLLIRRNPESTRVRWGRVIFLELAAFFALMALAILGGGSLERAEAGLDGGRVGWSLARLLSLVVGDLWRNVIIILGLLVTLVAGLNLLPKLEALLWKLAGEEPPLEVQPVKRPAIKAAPVASTQDGKPNADRLKPEPVKSIKKPEQTLPPEYRKNLRMPEAKDERPVAPVPRGERLPPLNLLIADQSARPDERHINQTAGLIEKTLAEFGIPAKVVGFRVGPTVTQFAIQPGFIEKTAGSDEADAQRLKVRVAQIASLQKDLALALSAERLRIEAPVPGRSYVGIEVPNTRSSVVRMRPILESDTFAKVGKPLTIALGRDVSGHPLVADLSRMPHLLVAGATGTGKSVCITAIAACLAMNNAPEDLRMILIDSKMVELIRFNGLAHLYGKVETDINRIMGVLRWVVVEMEHRYRLLEGAKARDIDAYNARLSRRKDTGGVRTLPRIVVIVDELADLMMSAPDQTEHNLVRLAQMARATGIHLVVATQRPSTDVVTGLIKANFPARLSFSVASGVDSRVILDVPGAENLLGRGDMLFLNPEIGNLLRAQGVLVTDQEIERIIAFWQKMSAPDHAAGDSAQRTGGGCRRGTDRTGHRDCETVPTGERLAVTTPPADRLSARRAFARSTGRVGRGWPVTRRRQGTRRVSRGR